MDDAGTGLVVARGAAWWVECPWGYPYDGWQCHVWVAARLWPDAEVITRDRPVTPRAWAWPKAAPAGFRLATRDDDRVLACTPPRGKRQVLRSPDDGEQVHSHVWVATSPPRLLVVYGSEGLADLVPTRWALHDGCAAAPVVQGTRVEPGPDGLWVAWEGDDDTPARQAIWRGGERLGEVAGEIRFRPAPM